jgi:hypothetical protein
MKRKWIIGGLLLATCAGCQGMNNTTAGAVGGGIVGGAVGTGVGLLTGRPAAGALIGAGAGAGLGALAGHSEDRAEARAAARDRAIATANARPPLSLQDVVVLTQQHMPPQMIIDQMQTTNSYYNLTAEDLIYLRQNGVSDAVISVMQARRPPPVVQTVRPAGVVVYDPYPPPPVSVGVGFGYGWGPRRHCW